MAGGVVVKRGYPILALFVGLMLVNAAGVGYYGFDPRAIACAVPAAAFWFLSFLVIDTIRFNERLDHVVDMEREWMAAELRRRARIPIPDAWMARYEDAYTEVIGRGV